MKKILIALLTLAFMAPICEAQTKRKKKRKKRKKARTAQVYKAPWGMAGCGIGALVIKENSKMQILAATLNNIVSPQTSAITSGTSGCSNSSKNAAVVESEVFVAANLNSLQKEVSVGEGVVLRNFAEILGCNANDAMTENFGKLGQQNFEMIFGTENPEEIVDKYISVIKANDELAIKCARIG